ncbi:MAG: phosphohistidine phosphatase [Actinomycetota bacterium]|jgi:phosphohistidine phosphatase|nr:phosphohistidine phosphatase [Actinomycetota bacterium]
MADLVIMRHAKSAWPEGFDDIERPLDERGRREAPFAGRWIRRHHAPDVVVCSPALRTRQTWDLVAGELQTVPEVRFDERLYATSAETYATVVRELAEDARTALLIGHNPDVEDLVTLLTGSSVGFKTGTIAVLTSTAAWKNAGRLWASVETSVTPRD